MSSWLSCHPGLQPVKPWLNTLWSERGSKQTSQHGAQRHPDQMQGHDLSTEVLGNTGCKGRCSSMEQYMYPEPTTVPRWRKGQEPTQHHKRPNLKCRFPPLSHRGHGEHQASKAEIRVYLPRAGAAWFLAWGLSEPRNKCSKGI